MSPSDDAWYVESFGEDYLELYRHRNLEEARKAVALAASVLNLRPDVSILDLCCGAGRHIQAMRNRGLAAIGMDLSPVLLGAARRCAGAVSLVRGVCLFVTDHSMLCYPFSRASAISRRTKKTFWFSGKSAESSGPADRFCWIT